MSNTIPCPNPICTHQFSAAELQTAAQVVCPKCKFRMQGKGKSPNPSSTPAPAAVKPTASPSAKPAPPSSAGPAVVKPTSAPAPASVKLPSAPAPAVGKAPSAPAPAVIKPASASAPAVVKPASAPAPALIKPASSPAPAVVKPASAPAPAVIKPASAPAPAVVKPASAPAPAAVKPAPAPAKAVTNPCPNPTCTHQFSVADFQTVGLVVCPKCGFRMQGKGKPAPAAVPMEIAPKPKPAPPIVAAPVPPAATPIVGAPLFEDAPLDPVTPAATPIAGAPPFEDASVAQVAVGEPPLAAPVADEETPFDPQAEPVIRAAPVNKKVRWVRIALIVFAFGFAACIIIVAIGLVVWWLKSAGANIGGGDEVGDTPNIGFVRNMQGVDEKVFEIKLNRKEWLTDTEIGPKYGTRFAWKNLKQDVWFALIVRDYGSQRPRDADVLALTIDKLKSNFEGLELAEKAEGLKINNLAMQRLAFRGQVTASTWVGECYMFFYNGIAYWFYIASPDGVEDFATPLLENNFKVLSDRRGWREQPPPTETHIALNQKIALTFVKDPHGDREWVKEKARDEDENGELAVRGVYKTAKDNRKNALLVVFTQERKDKLSEAAKAVREYLAKKEENDPARKLVNVNDKEAEGRVEDVGDRRGQIIDMKLRVGDEATRYYLLAVVAEPDITYGIVCHCPWESRQIWRQEFLEVLRTMKVKN